MLLRPGIPLAFVLGSVPNSASPNLRTQISDLRFQISDLKFQIQSENGSTREPGGDNQLRPENYRAEEDF